MLIALSMTSSFLARQPDNLFLTSKGSKGAQLVYIIVVAAVYNILLRNLWHPHGLGKLADCLLHQFIPVFYLVYWLCLVEKDHLHWKKALKWTLFPLTYLGYLLIGGAIAHYYPYPFIDVNHLGYSKVAVNSVGLLSVFIFLGLAVIAWDRYMKRSTTVTV